jgi:hypothetical protein
MQAPSATDSACRIFMQSTLPYRLEKQQMIFNFWIPFSTDQFQVERSFPFMNTRAPFAPVAAPQ